MRELVIKVAMTHRDDLQKHPDWWAATAKFEPMPEPGDVVRFECHGAPVHSGIVTAVLAPGDAGPGDGKMQYWWRLVLRPLEGETWS